jgi:hypothetical protein
MKEKIPDILSALGVKTYKSGDILVSNCPIHAGDNTTAFNVNVNVDSEFCGKWFCNTKGCHNEYGGDILGLVRALLSRDRKVTFGEVVEFSNKFCGTQIKSFQTDLLTNILSRGKPVETGLTREEIRKKLVIPAKYYIDRGFSPEVLDEFDVGLCTDPTKPMYNRVVFPVYNYTGDRMIGCVGRTTTSDPTKWLNQKGFKKGDHIYGYAKALPYVCRTGTAILVEGQGDFLKLWMAGIKNVFGMFGSQLNSVQELLLQRTGAMNIVTFGDADEAGEKFRIECGKKLGRLFNIRDEIPEGDAGEMAVVDLRQRFSKFLAA